MATRYIGLVILNRDTGFGLTKFSYYPGDANNCPRIYSFLVGITYHDQKEFEEFIDRAAKERGGFPVVITIGNRTFTIKEVSLTSISFTGEASADLTVFSRTPCEVETVDRS